MKKVIFIALLALLYAGCASVNVPPVGAQVPPAPPSVSVPKIDIGKVIGLPAKIVDMLLSPLKNLTTDDAQSVLDAVSSCDAAIKLDPAAAKDFSKCPFDPAKKVQTVACPNSVIAVADFYNSFKEGASFSTGKSKALIWYGELAVNGNGGGAEQQAKNLVLNAVNECAKLIPANHFSPSSLPLIAGFGGST